MDKTRRQINIGEAITGDDAGVGWEPVSHEGQKSPTVKMQKKKRENSQPMFSSDWRDCKKKKKPVSFVLFGFCGFGSRRGYTVVFANYGWRDVVDIPLSPLPSFIVIQDVVATSLLTPIVVTSDHRLVQYWTKNKKSFNGNSP